LKNKKDECFCEKCEHEKASECIKLACTCCLEADKIRLEHPVFEEGENEEGQRNKSSDEKYWEGRRDVWMTDMGGVIAQADTTLA
jgi:hypothetical protein